MQTLAKRQKLLVAAIVLTAAVLVPAVVVNVGLTDSPETAVILARDLAASAGHPLMGVMSSLGAFLWFSSGALPLFVLFLTFGRSTRTDRAFLLCSAALSFYLWFDDFFMFHEVLAWQFFDLRAPAIYTALAVVSLVYVAVFARRIIKTEYLWLGAAYVFMALAVADDLFAYYFVPESAEWTRVAQDSFKWIGAVVWARYHIVTSFLYAMSRMAGADAPRNRDAEILITAKSSPSSEGWNRANAA